MDWGLLAVCFAPAFLFAVGALGIFMAKAYPPIRGFDEPLHQMQDPWQLVAARDRGLAANGILTTCQNVRFLAMRPRIRARVSWPGKQWVRA